MPSKTQDNIFKQKKTTIFPFAFNREVAHVFDDMVARSIPFYGEIHQIILDLIDRYYKEGDIIYDLGCSTGSTIKAIQDHLDKKKQQGSFIGLDNSHDMLKKCHEKLSPMDFKALKLIHQNIEDIDFETSGVIIMNYTLQFLPPKMRMPLLERIYRALKPGGIFILSEKIISNDLAINNLLTELYYDFKKRNGYSQLEISQKREALESVLRPVSSQALTSQLQSAGFPSIEMLFKCYNFASFVGFKK